MKNPKFSATVAVAKKAAADAGKKVVRETAESATHAYRKQFPLAVVAVGAVGIAVGHHFGVDVRAAVESTGLSMETAAAAVVGAALTIANIVDRKFRRAPIDQQDVVTPR